MRSRNGCKDSLKRKKSLKVSNFVQVIRHQVLMVTFCYVVKEDIMKTMQHFHDFRMFEKSLNATYVAVIPKRVGALELTDFRPISLISGVYKIIAKVLAERLKKVSEQVGKQTPDGIHKGEADHGCCSHSQ